MKLDANVHWVSNKTRIIPVNADVIAAFCLHVTPINKHGSNIILSNGKFHYWN